MVSQGDLPGDKTPNFPEKPKESPNPAEQIPPEILKDLTPEVQSKLKSFFSMSATSMSLSRTRVLHPMADKITSEHIGDFIKNADRQDERQYQYSVGNRRYVLAGGVIGIVFILVLVFILLNFNKPLDLVIQILVGSGLLGGGFWGGYGYCKSKKE